MKSENKNCQSCKKDFTIDSEDFNFYEKIKVPPPTFCPECRLIRRLLWRNERSLYKRNCDMCGQSRILQYSADAKYKVYCRECWWSDKWEGADMGREYDFSRSFFEQFAELIGDTPRVGNIKQGNIINSEYTNRVSDLKNCYLIYGSFVNENCSYGSWMNDSKDCMDCYGVQKCERCYECIDCSSCYNLSFSQESTSSSNSMFLFNCRNCESCFGCVNLRNKSYCFFNKQYTREEYLKIIKDLELDKYKNIKNIEEKFKEFKNTQVYPWMIQHQSEKISGNWIEQSKNVLNSFNCKNVEDSKYLFSVVNSKDSMDYAFFGRETELVYDSINIGRQASNILFSNKCWDGDSFLTYCINCHGSSNLFGCIGLKKKEYCILNKQYTKEEYIKKKEEIMEHMKKIPFMSKSGHKYFYGEFFPPELSFFAYNETIAQEFFPKTKEELLEYGYMWKEPAKKNYIPTVTTDEIENFSSENDKITEEIIECLNKGDYNQQCTSAFKVTIDELQFYRRSGLPFPRFCPNCRHYERLSKRQPMKLFHRACMCPQETHSNHKGKCEVEFETSHASDRPEIVYCEKCYQQEVY